jgi:hypothetical protein
MKGGVGIPADPALTILSKLWHLLSKDVMTTFYGIEFIPPSALWIVILGALAVCFIMRKKVFNEKPAAITIPLASSFFAVGMAYVLFLFFHQIFITHGRQIHQLTENTRYITPFTVLMLLAGVTYLGGWLKPLPLKIGAALWVCCCIQSSLPYFQEDLQALIPSLRNPYKQMLLGVPPNSVILMDKYNLLYYQKQVFLSTNLNQFVHIKRDPQTQSRIYCTPHARSNVYLVGKHIVQRKRIIHTSRYNKLLRMARQHRRENRLLQIPPCE